VVSVYFAFSKKWVIVELKFLCKFLKRFLGPERSYFLCLLYLDWSTKLLFTCPNTIFNRTHLTKEFSKVGRNPLKINFKVSWKKNWKSQESWEFRIKNFSIKIRFRKLENEYFSEGWQTLTFFEQEKKFSSLDFQLNYFYQLCVKIFSAKSQQILSKVKTKLSLNYFFDNTLIMDFSPFITALPLFLKS